MPRNHSRTGQKRPLLLATLVAITTFLLAMQVGTTWVRSDQSHGDGPVRTGWPFEEEERRFNIMTDVITTEVRRGGRLANRVVYAVLAAGAGGLVLVASKRVAVSRTEPG